MIHIDNTALYRIDQLIQKRANFAVYKKPNDPSIHFVMQERGAPLLLSSFSELNEKEGFVIAPFAVSKEEPIVLLRIDRRSFPSQQELDHLPVAKEAIEVEEEPLAQELMFNRYQRCFDAFKKPLEEKKVKKIVLARHKVIERANENSLASLFKRACRSYPNSFVYLMHTPQTGVWIGSTPEVLLWGENKQWKTVALAGTIPYEEGVAPRWSKKNRLEQDLVVQYLKGQLGRWGITPQVTGPTTIRAGEIAHLVSHFTFWLDSSNRLGEFIELLHPTPAVCGLPKEEAFRYIVKNEGQNRGYYSGFIGELSPIHTRLFVNLRCMQVGKSCYTLYAGGGLLPSSQLLEEWQETERKMRTMSGLLQ